MNIPIVDVSDIYVSNTIENYQKVGGALKEAFEKYGFVYIVGHRISSSVIQRTFETSKNFFELSSKLKLKYTRTLEIYQGYVASNQEILVQEGFERQPNQIRESYDVISLEPNARFPDEHVPEMRDSILSLVTESLSFLHHFFRSLAFAVQSPNEDFFLTNHGKIFGENNSSNLRVLYYPKIENEDETAIRCGAHSDYGTLTLLFQDDLGGLEIFDVSTSSWSPASPIKNAILVNVGDLLEIWTGGQFPSTLHRVVIPKEEKLRKKPRQSIAFFVHPTKDVIVAPLVSSDKKFSPISALDHLNQRLNSSYQY